LCTLTRNLHRNFECGVANNVKQNPKVFWSYVKSRLKTHVNIGSVEGLNGQLHHSDCGRANAFNDFFSSVFVNEDPNTVSTFSTNIDGLPLLSNIKATSTTVFDKLQNLKTDKSHGPDG